VVAFRRVDGGLCFPHHLQRESLLHLTAVQREEINHVDGYDAECSRPEEIQLRFGGGWGSVQEKLRKSGEGSEQLGGKHLSHGGVRVPLENYRTIFYPVESRGRR